ncbi:MAG: NAD(P)H-dependent oxidoreductase [Chitinophagaceae bacterium]|nr:MAG: NAD(P)H-dependent oxidoreductase [Chitinophagaceae bacterium]
MKKYKVGVIVGSLRKESFNLKTAKALMEMASENFACELVKIGGLEMYNQDSDESPSPQYAEFRNLIKGFNAFLFVTPEYNRSMPAVLKNALDIASRPYGQSAWDGKPAGIVSVSISALGAFGANHHLRQSLVFLNMPAMAQPEAYIGNAQSLFDDSGKLTNDSTRDFLKKFMQVFEKWVSTHSS